MRRRDFAIALAAAAAGWPSVARAQSTATPKIGFLNSESRARFSAFLNVFLEGLNETGFAEGKNVAIDYRWAEGENARLPALAAELVNEHVDVIAAPGSTPAALAAKRATATIPVVIFTAGDPVELGLVARLSRPGGDGDGIARQSDQSRPCRRHRKGRAGRRTDSRTTAPHPAGRDRGRTRYRVCGAGAATGARPGDRGRFVLYRETGTARRAGASPQSEE